MRKLVSAIVLFCFATQVLAWGREGHEIVAELAQRQLKPAALAEVKRLLASEPDASLAAIADWAGELREKDAVLGKQSEPWHYVNFPRNDCVFTPARECPGGNCLVAAINRYFLVLSDTGRPDAERAQALKFLVHFVGDAHQPLHAGYGDDRGGNKFQIQVDGKGINLHRVWDFEIIGSKEPDFRAYADSLETRDPLPPDATAQSDRPAVDWVEESCKIVNGPDFYPASHTITHEYYDQHRPLAEQRMRQAASRLAMMINFALAPAPKTTP